MDLEELRDIVIVVYGIMGAVALFVGMVVILVVGLAARSLIANVNSTLRDSVVPTLNSARDTVDNVRGAASFVSDTAVSPVIRLYSLFAGLRRGLAVFLGLVHRGSRKR